MAGDISYIELDVVNCVRNGVDGEIIRFWFIFLVVNSILGELI